MDDFSTSVDTSTVSEGGEVSSPPAESSVGVAETTTGVDLTQSTPAQSQSVNGGESVATNPGDEFPDDAAFQAMPGQERVTAWQNVRARIAELNGQVKELSGKTSQYDSLGDLEQLKTDAELTRSLFTYRQDEQGNLVKDANGLPLIDTTQWQDQMQQQAPDAYYTALWEAMDRPIDQNDKVGDWLLRQKYGLDPQLLETYRQIQSPQDVARYAPQAVSSLELQGIPTELHEAYKSFEAEDRVELQDLFTQNEERFLARLSERKENLENRKFIQEQRQREEQAQQQQKQQWEDTIKQKTLERGQAKWDQTVQSQLDRLKTQYQPFGPEDSDGNQMVYADVIAAGERALSTPALQQKTQSAWHQYHLHEYYTATGNTMLAARALADGDKLVLELQREFAKAATQRVEQWNNRLKGKIAAAPVSQQPALGRPNQPTQPQQPANNGQHREPGRFGLSPDRINQIATQLALEKAKV